MLPSEPRLADISTFLHVCRTGSITATAREQRVTPSQVSKAVARLEEALQARLVTRGARGVGLSAVGRQMQPRLQQVIALVQSVAQADGPPDGELTLAAPSALLGPILPHVIRALPRARVRGLEMPAELVRSHSAEELFDMALLSGSTAGLSAKWASLKIGELRKALFASPAVARELGPRPTIDQIRRRPFVTPVAYDGGEFLPSDDDCPLGRGERLVGSEVGTMDLALQVAAHCGHLVFGPVLAARRELAEGRLVELRVPGWDVSEELFLACDAERVLARVQTQIVAAVRVALYPLTSNAATGT
jgi:DNA-binding transcriptional LysR family regulator